MESSNRPSFICWIVQECFQGVSSHAQRTKKKNTQRSKYISPDITFDIQFYVPFCLDETFSKYSFADT